ncbi:MAG: GNAT family N-acetyltransferase [Spirochaetes bacterium]|nr:GNAT family N-acetyltransferase [Spirochaetota bacterium]
MTALVQASNEDLNSFIESFRDSELAHFYFTSDEMIKASFYEFLAEKTVLKLEMDGTALGFICYISHGAFHSYPYIHLLTVLPECRGKGFGKQALDLFEENYAAERGKIFLVVADFNPDAKSFYERNGYCQVGIIPGLYRSGINESLMMKNL